jgi:predicted Na+-dependent transporter
MAEDNSKLDPEIQSTIAWTICCINAFCMMCSGLSIDIMALVKYLRAHLRWQILVGLVCQLMVMPLVALCFTPMLDEAQSFAVLIQATCPGSAIAMLFSAWCHGNGKVVQSMASFGTLSAIVLIPIWMSIFAAAYEPSDDAAHIPVPYWPIVRTLLILITALIIGMTIRFFFPRQAKKVSKMGTILSIFVIFTFVVFGVLFYEGHWWPGLEMSMCAMFIPMVGFACGGLFATAGKVLLATLVHRGHVTWIEPIAVNEYGWPEVRSIALACGLQNTQFAMSSIFGAFHQEEFVTRMHAYSPMYGVFSMMYAFILSAAYRSYELYRLRNFKEIPATGPRIPNMNIEEYECPEALRKQMKTNEDIINVLRRKLPSSLMDALTKTEVGDTDTVESVHRTIQKTLGTIDRTDLNDQEYRNLEAFRTAVDIFQRRISTVPPSTTDNSELRERRNIEVRTVIEEEDAEPKSRPESTSSSRFSIKKAAPVKGGWQMVKEKLVAKLSTDKYMGDEYTSEQKTMDTFVDDNDSEGQEARESAQSLECRFQQVVEQVVEQQVKPKTNRFAIKSVSDTEQEKTPITEQVVVSEEKKTPKLSNRFSIKSVSDIHQSYTSNVATAEPSHDLIDDLVSEMVIKPVTNTTDSPLPDIQPNEVPTVPIGEAVKSRFTISLIKKSETDSPEQSSLNKINEVNEDENEVFC